MVVLSAHVDILFSLLTFPPMEYLHSTAKIVDRERKAIRFLRV